MTMNNRRIEKRVRPPGRMAATITYCDAPKSVNGGTIGDISPQGMFMVADSVLHKDAYVTMKLDAEKISGKPIYIQGLVVRTDEKGMAIRFTYANNDDISTLMNR
jgi:hypothetical protein